MSYAPINAWTKIVSSPSYLSTKKEFLQKGKNTTTPTLSKGDISHKLSQEESQDQRALFDEAYSQAKHSISLIKDPL
jgi:hypothetical protein